MSVPRRAGAVRPAGAAAEECVAEEAADAGDPERDRVVDDDRRGGLGGGRAVGDQRAGEATLEDAEASGHRDQVGEVADQVGEYQWCDGEWVTGGGECRRERGDVEP